MALTHEQRGALERMEMVDARMVEVLSAKTPGERLAIARAMWRSARDMLRNLLGAEHPDWSQAQVEAEAARRLSHGTR